MICPNCNGSGESIASHVSYADGRHGFNVLMKCHQCGGAKEVPDEMAEWIKLGRQMREARVNAKPYRTLHEEAGLRGLSPAELSRMEFGKVKPTPGPDFAERLASIAES